MISPLFAAAVLVFSAQSVQATVCSVDLEAAYQEAIQIGWSFACHPAGAVGLNFDLAKRVGCSGRTAALAPLLDYAAHLFCPSGRTGFRNGWALHSYEVIGGEFRKLSGTHLPDQVLLAGHPEHRIRPPPEGAET